MLPLETDVSVRYFVCLLVVLSCKLVETSAWVQFISFFIHTNKWPPTDHQSSRGSQTQRCDHWLNGPSVISWASPARAAVRLRSGRSEAETRGLMETYSDERHSHHLPTNMVWSLTDKGLSHPWTDCVCANKIDVVVVFISRRPSQRPRSIPCF